MDNKRKISNCYMTDDELRKWQEDQNRSSILENVSNDIIEYIANFHSSNLLQESAINMAIQSHGLHQHNDATVPTVGTERNVERIIEDVEDIPHVTENIVGVDDVMEQAVSVAIQVQGLNASTNLDNQTR